MSNLPAPVEDKNRDLKINIGEFLTRRSNLTPAREALVFEDIRRTYKDLNNRANRLANAITGKILKTELRKRFN